MATFFTALAFFSLHLYLFLSVFSPQSSVLAAPAGTFPDLFNRRFPLRSVHRIVSLAPSTTEMLFALGLADRIVGVTSDCNYPPAARRKPQVGKFAFINREKLVDLRPDVIVAPAELRTRLAELQAVAAPLVGIRAPDMPAVFAALRLLGDLTGQQQYAAGVIEKLHERVRVAERTAGRLPHRRRVFYYLWPDPLMTAGTDSFIGDVLRRAGGDSIAGRLGGDGGTGTFSLEQLVAGRPDAIVVPRTLQASLERTIGQPPWGALPAVQEQRIIPIEDDWIARPGPRAVLALEWLQRAFAR